MAGSRKFYTELPGWTASETPAPLRFTCIAVADVDAGAKRAVEPGGTVHREPFDIPGVGRVAIVADPGGAAVGLYRAMSMQAAPRRGAAAAPAFACGRPGFPRILRRAGTRNRIVTADDEVANVRPLSIVSAKERA